MPSYRDEDFTERLGRAIADIFLVLLALFFIYGFAVQFRLIIASAD
jgi:hypothetical protein